MMVTTHATMGAALAVLLVPVSPHLAAVAALAAGFGGVLPDVDIFVGEHRRTLHFPVYYTALAFFAGLFAVVHPVAATVAAAAFVGGAALHSVLDVFGGGLSPRPWISDDHRGVYCHVCARWIHPRHWVRWDGAPEDFALFAVCAAVALVAFAGPVRWLVLFAIPLSALYTALRRRLPELAPWLIE